MYWIGVDTVPRNAEIVRCEACGGSMTTVPASREEMAKYNCGRSYECCVRAFVCEGCGKRLAVKLGPPEME